MDNSIKKYVEDISDNGNEVTGIIIEDKKFEDLLEDLNSIGFSYVARKILNKCPIQLTDDHLYCKDPRIRNIQCPAGAPFPYYNGEIKKYTCSQYGTKEEKKRIIDAVHKKPRKQRRLEETKKVGCKSKMTLKEIFECIDEEYAGASFKSKRQKTVILAKIKQSSSLKIKRHLSITIKMEHNHEPTDITKRPIAPALCQLIEEYVREGVTGSANVKSLLKQLTIGKEFTGYSTDNSRYFPSNKTIYNLMHRYLLKLKGDQFDQEALGRSIENLEKESRGMIIFAQPFSESVNGQVVPLLFCHQEQWQKDMLVEYGNEICLLDVTYRTPKYSLPLFFILVKANIKFMPVATFITMTDSGENISKALEKISEWNPNWKPEHCIIDCSEAKIKGIKSTFPDCEVQFCRFYVEQSWESFCKTISNEDAEKFLFSARSMANSATKFDFKCKLKEMETSSWFSENTTVRDYFNDFWRRYVIHWVRCYSSQTLKNFISTKSGIKTLRRNIKETCLLGSFEKPLTEFIGTIIKEYLPDCRSKYLSSPITAPVVKCSVDIPAFLQGRPKRYIDHVMSRIDSAKKELSRLDYIVVGDKTLICKSFTLDFESVTCSCKDFQKHSKLCKHFCGAFLFFENFGPDKLPTDYFNNSLLSKRNTNRNVDPAPSFSNAENYESIEETPNADFEFDSHYLNYSCNNDSDVNPVPSFSNCYGKVKEESLGDRLQRQETEMNKIRDLCHSIINGTYEVRDVDRNMTNMWLSSLQEVLKSVQSHIPKSADVTVPTSGKRESNSKLHNLPKKKQKTSSRVEKRTKDLFTLTEY